MLSSFDGDHSDNLTYFPSRSIILREEAGDERHRPRAGVRAPEEEVLARRKVDGRPRRSALRRRSIFLCHGSRRLRFSAAANGEEWRFSRVFSLSLLSVYFTGPLKDEDLQKIFFEFAVCVFVFIFLRVWLPYFCVIWKERWKVHGRGEKWIESYFNIHAGQCPAQLLKKL